MSGPASTSIVHRLVYRAVTSRTPVLAKPNQSALEQPSTTETEIILHLGPDWQSSREGATETIVDATATRRHVIDHDAGTVGSQSLFADVSFRVTEASNRLMILQVIEAGGASAGTRADVEASLGVEVDAPRPPRFRRALLRRNQWMLGRQKIATHEASEHELPVRMLRRWFAHEVMLHPRLAEELASTGRAPRRLQYRVRLIPEVYERSLSLVSVDEVEVERDALLRDLAPTPPRDELHARVRELYQHPPEGLPDRMAMGHAALEGGRHLEAFLWFMAHTWVSDDPSGMLALNQVLRKEEFTYGFRLAVLTAGEGQHLDEVLKVYDMAEREAGDLGHVVDVIRANALTAIASQEREPERREELLGRARAGLIRAIHADPGLAGVYNDLGDLYMQSYDMGVAWDLWEIGRRLAPDHAFWNQMARHEQYLRTHHSAFF